MFSRTSAAAEAAADGDYVIAFRTDAAPPAPAAASDVAAAVADATAAAPADAAAVHPSPPFFAAAAAAAAASFSAASASASAAAAAADSAHDDMDLGQTQEGSTWRLVSTNDSFDNDSLDGLPLLFDAFGPATGLLGLWDHQPDENIPFDAGDPPILLHFPDDDPALADPQRLPRIYLPDSEWAGDVAQGDRRVWACGLYPLCRRRYSNGCTATRHFSDRHMGQVFQCPRCGALFAEARNIRRHIRDTCSRALKKLQN
jgi:hypothetical protein